jgi:hypothetical protein
MTARGNWKNIDVSIMRVGATHMSDIADNDGGLDRDAPLISAAIA